jgi:signal peptidase I
MKIITVTENTKTSDFLREAANTGVTVIPKCIRCIKNDGEFYIHHESSVSNIIAVAGDTVEITNDYVKLSINYINLPKLRQWLDTYAIDLGRYISATFEVVVLPGDTRKPLNGQTNILVTFKVNTKVYNLNVTSNVDGGNVFLYQHIKSMISDLLGNLLK